MSGKVYGVLEETEHVVETVSPSDNIVSGSGVPASSVAVPSNRNMTTGVR